MKRKKLPKGIVRTSFHVLKHHRKNNLRDEIEHLERILRWIDIAYDDPKERRGEMAFFIFSFAKRHQGLLGDDLLMRLSRIQIPIKQWIPRSKNGKTTQY